MVTPSLKNVYKFTKRGVVGKNNFQFNFMMDFIKEYQCSDVLQKWQPLPLQNVYKFTKHRMRGGGGTVFLFFSMKAQKDTIKTKK